MRMKTLLSVALLSGTLVCNAEPTIGSVLIPRDNAGKPAPRFSRGLTLFYDNQTQTLSIFDETGRLKAEASYSLPETNRVVLRDVTATPAGEVVASVSAVSADEKKSGAFLIWFNSKGAIARVVRTSPFGASRVISSPDGEVWALGLVRDPDGKNASGHDVLRRYGRDGQLKGSVLPRNSFAGTSHPVGEAILLSGDDRFAIYSMSAREYVELHWDGTLLQRRALPDSTDQRILTGGCILPSGIAYIGRGKEGPENGPVVYKLDPRTGEQKLIDIPAKASEPRLMTLLGCAGGELAIYGRPVSVTRYVP